MGGEKLLNENQYLAVQDSVVEYIALTCYLVLYKFTFSHACIHVNLSTHGQNSIVNKTKRNQKPVSSLSFLCNTSCRLSLKQDKSVPFSLNIHNVF